MLLDSGERTTWLASSSTTKNFSFSFVDAVGSGIRERELPGKLHQQQQKFSHFSFVDVVGSGRENYLVSFINNNQNFPLLFCWCCWIWDPGERTTWLASSLTTNILPFSLVDAVGFGRENYLVSFIINNKNFLLLFCWCCWIWDLGERTTW